MRSNFSEIRQMLIQRSYDTVKSSSEPVYSINYLLWRGSCSKTFWGILNLSNIFRKQRVKMYWHHLMCIYAIILTWSCTLSLSFSFLTRKQWPNISFWFCDICACQCSLLGRNPLIFWVIHQLLNSNCNRCLFVVDEPCDFLFSFSFLKLPIMTFPFHTPKKIRKHIQTIVIYHKQYSLELSVKLA